MRDFRELNQQVNEVKRMLNSFIQKLTAQVEKFTRKDLQKTPFKVPVKLRAVLRNSEYFEEVVKGDRLKAG